MLPKKYRLSKTADVNLTTAKGRSFFSQSFIVKFLNKPTDTTPLITAIASTKVSKSAVVRNRLKRIIRQVVQEHLKQFKPGNYVFIIKKTAVIIPAPDLHKEVAQALKKSKIIS